MCFTLLLVEEKKAVWWQWGEDVSESAAHRVWNCLGQSNFHFIQFYYVNDTAVSKSNSLSNCLTRGSTVLSDLGVVNQTWGKVWGGGAEDSRRGGIKRVCSLAALTWSRTVSKHVLQDVVLDGSCCVWVLTSLWFLHFSHFSAQIRSSLSQKRFWLLLLKAKRFVWCWTGELKWEGTRTEHLRRQWNKLKVIVNLRKSLLVHVFLFDIWYCMSLPTIGSESMTEMWSHLLAPVWCIFMTRCPPHGPNSADTTPSPLINLQQKDFHRAVYYSDLLIHHPWTGSGSNCYWHIINHHVSCCLLMFPVL